MSSEAICPHCGFDLQAVQTLRIGEWTAFRSGHIAFRDDVLPLGSAGRIVQALMRSYPNPLRREVLADRLGCSDASLSVILSKVRRVLREHGARDMIVLLRGEAEQQGYMWCPDKERGGG